MVRCSIMGCKSDTKEMSTNISFHCYPKNYLRKIWIEATGRTNWVPTKSSALCSRHFEKRCLIKKKKFTSLRPGSVPTLEINSIPMNSCILHEAKETNDQRNSNYCNSPVADYVMTPCDLEVCRICFATDCKLYPMTIYKKLDKAYKMLTGLSMQNEDNLPPYLCVECAHRLVNCIRFRTRSLRAHLIMLELIKKQNEVTLESIKSIAIEHRLASNLALVHNQIDHYDLEIDHDTQDGNKISDEIKVENNMIGHIDENTNNCTMIHIPPIDEYNIKVEMETQGFLNYEYTVDEHKDDVTIDDIKIEGESIPNNENPYCSNILERAVIEETAGSEFKQMPTDGNEINKDQLFLNNRLIGRDNIMRHDKHDTAKSVDSEIFEHAHGVSRNQ